MEKVLEKIVPFVITGLHIEAKYTMPCYSMHVSAEVSKILNNMQ